MGSSNGSWFNSTRLAPGKKVVCAPTDIVHLGKVSAGITITVEAISVKNILEKPASKVLNSDNEKTLVYKIEPMKTQIQEEKMVANGSPVARQETRTKIALVDNQPLPPRPGHTGIRTIEHKSGLEDKVKNLINQESEKLREIALKQSNEIIKKAHEEEKDIIHNAQREAQDIISQARLESERLKHDANETILSLQERVRETKIESDEMIKGYKNTAFKIESSIQTLKKEESQFNQKIKHLEENVYSIQEKIKNENYLLEDIKSQSQTIRKNAEVKLEEIALEERRARARMETELFEARSQTAKVFAEAEKIQVQKEMIESEISQFKTDKSQIEREINELQINLKRQEYDFEKQNREFNTLLDKTQEAQDELDAVIEEGKGLTEKFEARQNALLEKESVLQEKITELQDSANSVIENAKAEALKITQAAQLKAKESSQHFEKELKDHEAKKTALLLELDNEKKAKLKEQSDELDKQKSTLSAELKKLEQKKEGIITENKWLEESAQKKCEKIVTQGIADAESLKVVLQKENERKQAAMELEYQARHTTLQKENEVVKANAQAYVLDLKNKATLEIAHQKRQAELEMAKKQEAFEAHVQQTKDTFAEDESDRIIKWDQKHAVLQEEIEAAKLVTKRHEEALAKTESLMDENFLEANVKIKNMMADAEARVIEMQKESEKARSIEQASLIELRKHEMEKIEELKAKFEQYKIDNRRDMAEQSSLAVEEFLINDMIKSRNLILNESLIRKIAGRAKKLVVEANLGRIEASVNGSKAFPKRDYRRMFRWFLRLSVLAAMVYGVFYAFETYPQEMKAIENEIRAFIKDNNITIPQELPTKDQIIDFLR